MVAFIVIILLRAAGTQETLVWDVFGGVDYIHREAD